MSKRPGAAARRRRQARAAYRLARNCRSVRRMIGGNPLHHFEECRRCTHLYVKLKSKLGPEDIAAIEAMVALEK